MAAMHADDEQLKSLIAASSKPVLIDFVAPWCGACKAMAPALDALAEACAQTLSVVKVDVDASPEAALGYRVRSLPTLVLVKDGKVLGTHVGALSQSQMADFVEKRLKAGQ